MTYMRNIHTEFNVETRHTTTKTTTKTDGTKTDEEPLTKTD